MHRNFRKLIIQIKKQVANFDLNFFIFDFSECGLVAHRTCSATGLPKACEHTDSLPSSFSSGKFLNRVHFISFVLKDEIRILINGSLFYFIFCYLAVFGVALSSLFDPTRRSAPAIVERCTRALEDHAKADPELDLYTVYHSSLPTEQTHEIRLQLEKGTKKNMCSTRHLPQHEVNFVIFYFCEPRAGPKKFPPPLAIFVQHAPGFVTSTIVLGVCY